MGEKRHLAVVPGFVLALLHEAVLISLVPPGFVDGYRAFGTVGVVAIVLWYYRLRNPVVLLASVLALVHAFVTMPRRFVVEYRIVAGVLFLATLAWHYRGSLSDRMSVRHAG